MIRIYRAASSDRLRSLIAFLSGAIAIYFAAMGGTGGSVGLSLLLTQWSGYANLGDLARRILAVFMTMAILERTREIGLMKVVGATDRAVLAIFLIEAGLVGLIGGMTGLGISYLLQYVVNTALADTTSGTITFLSIRIAQFDGTLIVIPTGLSLLASGLATSIGICAGLGPALRAARMNWKRPHSWMELPTGRFFARSFCPYPALALLR